MDFCISSRSKEHSLKDYQTKDHHGQRFTSQRTTGGPLTTFKLLKVVDKGSPVKEPPGHLTTFKLLKVVFLTDGPLSVVIL